MENWQLGKNLIVHQRDENNANIVAKEILLINFSDYAFVPAV